MKPLMEALRELEQAIKDFDAAYADYDLSTLTDHEVWKAEGCRLPIFKVHRRLHEERVRRADRKTEEMRRVEEGYRARYSYYFEAEGSVSKHCVIFARAYEKGVVEGALETCKDEETALQRIHRLIPPITDEEIVEYRREIEQEKEAISTVSQET